MFDFDDDIACLPACHQCYSSSFPHIKSFLLGNYFTFVAPLLLVVTGSYHKNSQDEYSCLLHLAETGILRHNLETFVQIMWLIDHLRRVWIFMQIYLCYTKINFCFVNCGPVLSHFKTNFHQEHLDLQENVQILFQPQLSKSVKWHRFSHYSTGIIQSDKFFPMKRIHLNKFILQF